ncbi:MAG: CPBP family intramembrane metalloprotease [Desulfobacteraceae bacterium]|nr:MAG: CPBP family intramembrane metalloprotease [Desulfobacteraceae bacterium]
MKNHDTHPGPLLITGILAAILWFVTFRVPIGNFWIKIAVSSSLLALSALWLSKGYEVTIRFNRRAFAVGLASAAFLYAVFRIGQTVSQNIFPFAEQQIGGIYTIGEGTPLWVIALLLFFITGPAEEFYWRGFLQHRLARRFGGWQGWLMGTGIYAGVHVFAWNFMLVGAAGVAGLFWGLLYWRLGNLAPVIISHAVWSVCIFAIFPTM